MTAPSIDRYHRILTTQARAVTADAGQVVVSSDASGWPQAALVPVAAERWDRPDGAEPCAPTALTRGAERVLAVAASPSAPRRLVVALDRAGRERTGLWWCDAGGGALDPLAADPEVIHRPGAFTVDGEGYCYTADDQNPVDFHVFVTARGRSPRRLAALPGWNTVHAADPAGAFVLVAHGRASLDTDTLLVSLRDGTVLARTEADRPALHQPEAVGSDGRILLRSDRDDEFVRAGWWTPGTDRWEPFGPSDRDAEQVAVGERLAVLVTNDDGRSRVHLLDLATGALGAELPLPVGVVTDALVAPGDRGIVLTVSGPREPPRVWVACPDATRVAPLTATDDAGLDRDRFALPTRAAAEAHDGLRIPLWVYRPQGVDRPPAVVWCHGGPESQARPRFDPLLQHLVARGMAVVAPDVRGSTGYGRAFAALDDGRRRGDAIADVAAVGRWVRAQDDLDGARIALAGRSYGGFLTLAGITTAPQLWAAAVSVVGIADLVAFLERTGAYRRARREAEYGSLEHDRDFLASISPIHQVDAIRCPLLVIHGANDPRVPVSEAHAIVAALRQRGRPVRLLVFDDEGHRITRRANRIQADGAIAGFLATHLLNA